MKLYHLLLCITFSVLFGACSASTIPEGAKAVVNFDKSKYLGTWYEVARLDFYFEKNLINTTANYSLNEDGSIKVVNRGYEPFKKIWKESVGKAKFVGKENVGMLKVSFFGPFYGGYNVVALDSNYQYALVAGEKLSYLWILSRKKTIPEHIKKEYLGIAEKIGYKTSDLIWLDKL
ncbi:lipocalin family protein [Aquirufa aurantiipilula]|uniref:Lipocalin family protein n=1 Tax=Aquirufa aurantiipilula TaxID=2696561 RepID=A0ABT6BLK4_9BACT|nr:lipocalin family protein [Aquirufa aurantiipilula]MBZ1325744.1 lipocalin [Aquirufa aurantiipilula]MDF5691342.1 lipocalin family protein [Aquirufa aurantiipilula]